MLKIITFRGGLGNQMFLYAFYLAQKRKNMFSILLIEATHCFEAHSGRLLSTIFSKIENFKEYKYNRRIQKAYSVYISKYLFKTINENNYLNKVSHFGWPFIHYEDYWQGEEYFKDIIDEVKDIYKFDEDKLNQKSAALTKTISNRNYISIHVRRGDYLLNDELKDICPISYYITAINYITSIFQNYRFCIFTDDPEWVQSNFNFIKYTLIDWNTDQDSWQDMFLMSKCKHNIIANSTFSWWGAWLNSNPDKIVITPKKWFNTLQRVNIVPGNWIKL